MGFNNPANPYLAAIQALIAFCHRRISRHALTLTATAPLQMMSGKQNDSGILHLGFGSLKREPHPCPGAVLLLNQMM